MPWKESNAVDLRTEFVNRALREDTPFTALCREFGISAKTGYKWKERFLSAGLPGLCDQSRRPHSSPAGISEDALCELVRLKREHMAWGPDKIRELYRRANPRQAPPSLSTVKRVLAKCNLVVPRRKRRPPEQCGRFANRIEALAPNQVWSVDFKGWWYSARAGKVQPLTVCDAYSRFLLLAQAVPDSTTATVQACFVQLFSEYGMPLVIRSDNGAPFAAPGAPLGLSRLSAWWVAQGVGLDRIAPGHPEQNGRHERMHRDLALEVEGRVDGDLTAQQAALDIWRRDYNQLRPHQALGMRLPSQIYVKSERCFSAEQLELEYPSGFCSRKVSRHGCIKLAGRLISISTAVGGWHVGLKHEGAGCFNVWFGSLCLGQLDLRAEKFTTGR
jgi:putative transposase